MDKELKSHDLAREMEISKLQEENEILKDNAEHNAKAVDKINWENMLLKKENQELKSQLRGTTHCFDEEEHNKLKEENQKLKKQVDEYKKDIKDLDNQNKNAFKNMQLNQLKVCNMVKKQKKFINYLEDEIKRINPKELDIGELNLRLDDIKFTQYLIYKEILQKYKSIIGVSDEKEN